MKFKVLSHAGLMVEHLDKQIIVDPWLIGSTYWRSWWNYPPVSQDLIESLHPDYVYLTHIHWDHFQSASLKLFPLDTPILCPKGHFDRMKRDLNRIGFKNVIELGHGESFQLGPDFKITSYSFDLLCDSTLVVETPNVTLLNLNDCKLMGLPLRHALSNHKQPDFVFSSHSSANSRACFEIIDQPQEMVDDDERYIERFYQFVTATKARYAVPFASNQCYLHRDTFKFNESGRTPVMVKEYWKRQKIQNPELKIMVSGDAWSESDGFVYTGIDWFTNRDKLLHDYQEEMKGKLKQSYQREESASISLKDMERFFNKFFPIVPFFIRSRFKDHPIVYVVTNGYRKWAFKVDIAQKMVTEIEFSQVNDNDCPLQIHIQAQVLKFALSRNILAHIGIGKRVQYRVTAEERKYAEMFKTLIDLHEYEILPLRNFLRTRTIVNWANRWREIILYIHLAGEKLITGKLNISRHLVPALPSIGTTIPRDKKSPDISKSADTKIKTT